MFNRYHDAFSIQQGACNPSGVARALVRAIDEARAENVDPREDVPCRMICHQLAFLLDVAEYDSGSLAYSRDMDVLESRLIASNLFRMAKQEPRDGEIGILAEDVRDVRKELGVPADMDKAGTTLLDRIGGFENLRSYMDSLMAGRRENMLAVAGEAIKLSGNMVDCSPPSPLKFNPSV